MRYVPILMYHAVADDASSESLPLAVTPRMFSSQLGRLRELDFAPITVEQLELAMRDGGVALPERPVVLTFDDGFANFASNALAMLERFAFTATVFITTGFVADDGADRIDTRPDRMLSWDQIVDANARGIEMGAHTHTHPQLDQLPQHVVRTEISQCKSRLEDRLQRDVTSFSYPFGYSNARVRRIVRGCGYRAACVVGNMLSRTNNDPFCLPRLTISRTMPLETFTNVVCGQHVPRIFFKERMLTKGWAVARRSRALLYGTPWRG
jgi:peptidoglycan/xylan/chitin deacetylase (PgdA/CDA1 family)